jgi:HEAT repeat protein
MLGITVLLFGLAMLHPYPRQLLFGPRIQGLPWCVWESQIRRTAAPAGSNSHFLSMLESIGLLQRPQITMSPELLPVFLHLASDDDLHVRRFCLGSLERRQLKAEFWRWSEEDEALILPVMRQRLADDDPVCRVDAALYLWLATGDREMIQVPLAYLDHPDPFVHRVAGIALCYLAPADPNKAYDPVVKLMWDSKSRLDVRLGAVQSMRHFGRRGLPMIRKALNDPAPDIRQAAMFAAREMGQDAKELVPNLLSLQDDVEPHIRRLAATTLNRLEPDRFPAPARE